MSFSADSTNRRFMFYHKNKHPHVEMDVVVSHKPKNIETCCTFGIETYGISPWLHLERSLIFVHCPVVLDGSCTI